MRYETFLLSLTPATLAKLEPLLVAASEAEWESDVVQSELAGFAIECRSRLQRIEKGDVQKTPKADVASLHEVAGYLGGMNFLPAHAPWVARAQEELCRLADLEF